ncbi:MAG: exosortase-dependent surface protein XDP2, partial [Cyanobacteria bacterium J06635_10]
MKFNKLVTSVGLIASTFLFSANSAKAADFNSNITKFNGEKGDVILNSIEQNGRTINQNEFSFVESVDSFSNT